MKTTLDIPEKRLQSLMKSGKFSSKKEAVNTAIEAYLRNKRKEALLQAAGTEEDFMSCHDLGKLRND
ncbi:MAG: type II toxin-antitoxin system VapB family antitoxin [Opitutales bacterium]|nr:type II toxin-antitoxin system VapB family antitoxin [Opitutales bacterium]MCH8541564.1 type II toxin-antitoxin system VapB family antitoxin [Opitutales bacterium]